jgi:glycosyltransferase involved in cell wall biosynthesis
MHIVCLTKRWQHHTASGGYDRLASAVGATVVERTKVSGLLSRLLRRLWTISSRSHLRRLEYRYEYEDFLAERRLLTRSRLQRPDVVHVLYADEQLDLLLRSRRLLPAPIVASFHLPTPHVTNRFERIHKHLLAGIDAAIVVSRCQLKDFRCWLGRDRVVYVPHGVDTRRFCPSDYESQEGPIRLMIVGHHMRDWEATRRIIDECNARKLPVQIDAVLARAHWPVFTRCANVQLHTGIPEDRLIGLYQQAHALLVPVVDSTANNAVLESLACGTPVISNAVGGIPDYVDETSGWLFGKGEVSGIVELIEQLCDNPEIAWSRREPARLKSLQFIWDSVAKQLIGVYEAVARGDSPAEAPAVREQTHAHSSRQHKSPCIRHRQQLDATTRGSTP